MRSFFQDLMIKKLLTWYENFLLKGSLNSLLNPWENNFKLKFMTKSQVHNKQGLFTLAAIMGTLKSVCSNWFSLISHDIYEHTHLRLWIDCSCISYFDLKKYMYSQINQHISSDPLTHIKSNFVFVLPMTTWKKSLSK